MDNFEQSPEITTLLPCLCWKEAGLAILAPTQPSFPRPLTSRSILSGCPYLLGSAEIRLHFAFSLQPCLPFWGELNYILRSAPLYRALFCEESRRWMQLIKTHPQVGDMSRENMLSKSCSIKMERQLVQRTGTIKMNNLES